MEVLLLEKQTLSHYFHLALSFIEIPVDNENSQSPITQHKKLFAAVQSLHHDFLHAQHITCCQHDSVPKARSQ